MQIKLKVDGETMPEVLISMVIILAVFTMSLTIYTRVTFGGLSLTDSQVQGEMESIIYNAAKGKGIKTLSIDSITYTTSMADYGDSSGLFVIDIQAEQNERIVGKMRRIINKNDQSPSRHVDAL